jgi:D-glucuronyl C5-epimerase C-terminus
VAAPAGGGIARVRRSSVGLLAVALALLLPVSAHAATTVPAALDGLLAAGAIDQPRHDEWVQSFDDAKKTLRRLHGTRRRQLDAVLDNTRALAAGGLLTAQRAPLAFLTLQRNRAWWAGGRLLRYGERLTFSGSQLVWQYYPGQGIQVQWLGTFGRANGLWQAKTRDAELRALLDEASRLAVPRAGGIAWESMFGFDGGRPPWVSGLTQGTAIQAYSRAAVRLQAPPYFEIARAALGVFRTPPPEGVRVDTPVGAHYLQYSFNANLHILNGFVQALNGLFDFASLANDAEGRALFASGEAQARVEVPTFDTGAWSLYQPGRESDLGYHKLLRDFLRGLCARVPDPAVYCVEADKLTAYLRQPPVIALKSTTARLRKPSKVTFTLNKVSTVSVTLLRRGKPVFSHSARFGYGRHAFAFRPRKRGALEVRLRAVDLAGNASAAAGSIAVRKAK